jgi:MarR family transcriptional regulator, transcriptional regulator for hemolysin
MGVAMTAVGIYPGMKDKVSQRPPSFEYAILRAGRAVRKTYDAHLAPLDLNFTEAKMLTSVRDSGPLPQRELAERLNIGKASMGTFIDGLERRGLVARTPDPSDRRVWKIELTAAASDVLVELDEIDERVRDLLRVGMSVEERKQVSRLLELVEANSITAIERAADAAHIA